MRTDEATILELRRLIAEVEETDEQAVLNAVLKARKALEGTSAKMKGRTVAEQRSKGLATLPEQAAAIKEAGDALEECDKRAFALIHKFYEVWAARNKLLKQTKAMSRANAQNAELGMAPSTPLRVRGVLGVSDVSPESAAKAILANLHSRADLVAGFENVTYDNMLTSVPDLKERLGLVKRSRIDGIKLAMKEGAPVSAAEMKEALGTE